MPFFLIFHIYIYIYIHHIHPNLEFGTAFLDQEREQGRFGGSSEGARGCDVGQC